ncbi:MAG: GIY-YIG nuclease family protein [Patescibacteria group bacterium]
MVVIHNVCIIQKMQTKQYGEGSCFFARVWYCDFVRIGQSPPTTFMYHVYVIKSISDKRLYIGSTNDVRRRLQEHNDGLSPATKNRRPFILVYCESYVSKTDALARERKLKKFKNSYSELKRRMKNSIDDT